MLLLDNVRSIVRVELDGNVHIVVLTVVHVCVERLRYVKCVVKGASSRKSVVERQLVLAVEAA